MKAVYGSDRIPSSKGVAKGRNRTEIAGVCVQLLQNDCSSARDLNTARSNSGPQEIAVEEFVAELSSKYR